jgi:membrane fusion protein, copper/silver efflux system
MRIRSLPIFVILGLGFLVTLMFYGCSKPARQTAADPNLDYYTCTMHPSVHSKTPGKCPICSMDLVPVKKKTAQNSEGQSPVGMNADSASNDQMHQDKSSGATPVESNEFTVPVERQQQIGVTYATVTKRPIQLSIRSVGMLESDTSRMFDYVARVDGYVQELKVSSPGQDVSQGQPLITIYSPDLRSTEQELVNILNDRDRSGTSRVSNDQLIDASKRRLKLWNVSDQEIAELEKSRRPSDQLVLRSPFDGVVGEVMSRPGMNVKMGDKLVSVLDLANLWVWAEFYENEIGLLERGQKIDVSLPAFPNQTFQGQIAVINPIIDAAKRTARVRIDIPNAKGQLRPGMYANVEVKINGGEGLTIPVQAALPTGERMLVFLDRGQGKLLPRYVQVGRSFTTFDGQHQESYYQVVKGLQEGDRIVTSANFLIDAESQVQGALKNWGGEQPFGAPAMTEKPPDQSSNSNFDSVVKPVLSSYRKLHQLLAENNFSKVSAEAELLRYNLRLLSDVDPAAKPERFKDLVDRLHRSAEQFTPDGIDQARIEFGQLSADIIAFLRDFMPQSDSPLYTIKCPMWKKSPAVWLQDSIQVENPFLGPDMATCGTVQETLRAER